MIQIFSSLRKRFQSFSVRQNAFNIGLLFTSSRIIGTLRESVISRAVSRDVYDMYTVAVKIPSMIRRLSSEGTLENAYVPSLAQFPKDDEMTASRWIAGIAAVIFIFSAIIVYFGISTVDFWHNLLLGQSYSQVNTLIFKQLFIVMLPIILCYFLSSTFIAILHKHEYFIHANVGQSIANVFMVITAYLGYKISNSHLILAICTLAGATAHLMWQYYGVSKISGRNTSEDVRRGFIILLIGWVSFFVLIFKILNFQHTYSVLQGTFSPNFSYIAKYLLTWKSTLTNLSNQFSIIYNSTLFLFSSVSCYILYRAIKNKISRSFYLLGSIIAGSFFVGLLFRSNKLILLSSAIFDFSMIVSPLLLIIGVKKTLPKQNDLQYGRLDFGPKLEFIKMPKGFLVDLFKSILSYSFLALIFVDIIFPNGLLSKIFILIFSSRNLFLTKDFRKRLPFLSTFGKYGYSSFCILSSFYPPIFIFIHLINNFFYIYRHNSEIEENNPIIKNINSKFLGIARNAFFGTGVHQMMSLVSVMVSVKIGAGAPSYMNRADKIMQFPIGILGVSFGMALLPRVSMLIAEKKYKEANKLHVKVLKTSILMSLLVIVVSIFIAEPVAKFFFFGGKTTTEDIKVICKLFKLQLIALPSSIILKTLYPIYFGLNRSVIISRAALLQCTIDVSLKIIFLNLKRDIYLMSLGWIIGSWVSAIYLLLHRRIILRNYGEDYKKYNEYMDDQEYIDDK